MNFMLQHLKFLSFIPCEREKLQLERRHYYVVLNLPGCDCVKLLELPKPSSGEDCHTVLNAFLYPSLSHCSALPLTYDQAFFFFGRSAKVWQRERRQSGEGRKTQRLIQLLHESSGTPCLLTRCYLVSCF